jgi:hypothetical protein
VDGNFTYFFDINSNGTYAQWLRSIVPFEDLKDDQGKNIYKEEVVDGPPCPCLPGMRRPCPPYMLQGCRHSTRVVSVTGCFQCDRLLPV